MKTQYTKLCQLRSAAGNLDVDSLAALLQEAEQAHARYEKTEAAQSFAIPWPTFYSEWLLGLRNDSGPSIVQDPAQARAWAEGESGYV